MNRRTKFVLAGTIAAVGIAGGTGIAVASGGDDGAGTPITGAALDRASSAALDQTGGGRVSGTEVGDEESYYQVEVTRADGTKVDVQLDRSFGVVSVKADGDQHQDAG